MPSKIHIIINEKGKFDVVIVSGKNLEDHTRQGYDQIAKCYGKIRSYRKLYHTPADQGITVQDDTGAKSKMIMVMEKGILQVPHLKPGKKYIPFRER